MKNSNKTFGTLSRILCAIALTAAIVFSMVACGDDDSGPPTPTVTAVEVSSEQDVVHKGNTIKFTATVTGTNDPAQTVTWSIVETEKEPRTVIGGVGGGLLSVNIDETLTSITVKATSTVDNTKSGTKTVAIIGWTKVADSKFSTELNNSDTIYSIAYGNNKFVAGGSNGKMAYSSDGVTWTAVTDSKFGSTNDIKSIAYGNNKFVAVSYWQIAYSSDGTTWTVAVYPFDTNSSGSRFAYYGNNKFVAVGGGNKIASSTDGVTWSSPVGVSSFTSSIDAIAYGNNKFVAVGSYGKMATSADGTTWTAVETNPFDGTNSIYAIAYGNNKFVAGDSKGKMATSADGVTWTEVPYSSTDDISPSINAIVYGNDKFVAGGNRGKIAYTTGY